MKPIKIILVATDSKKRSLVFVDENLKVYSLQEAVKVAKNGLFDNIYAVNRSGNLYLRTKPSVPIKDHIDKISISSRQLFFSLNDITHALSISPLQNYLQKFQKTLSEVRDLYIIIDGFPHILKESAKLKLQANKDYIFVAAKKFNVDPYLLAAILIDEMARLFPFEDIRDMLIVQFIGKDTSVGIGQVKIETARGLIRNGYYNPAPQKFSNKNISKISRQELYEYVEEPKYNIFFAAATMSSLIDNWKEFIDLDKSPKIIASLYSMEKKPHSDPQPNERGLQIANEFYNFAKEWLK